MPDSTRKPQGFAAMPAALSREIQRLGGQASQATGAGHRFRSAEEARAASAGGQLGRMRMVRGATRAADGQGPWPAAYYDELIDRKKAELAVAIATVTRLERTITAFERAKYSIYGD